MKHLNLLVLLLFKVALSYGQIIEGKVLDNSTNSPLEYASIGVINTRYGTITNEHGKFRLEIKETKDTSTIRFSMIGFETKLFKVKELIDNKKVIKLKRKTIEIDEVLVKPNNRQRKIGTTNRRFGKICGWEGNSRGKGHEIGSEFDLGNQPVRIESIHIRVHRQSFDSSLFRLHIRTIKNKLPDKELLGENILIPVTVFKGWTKFDLSNYNIIMKGKVAVSLEWLKVLGLDKNKLISVNNREKSANVLFSMNKKKGISFLKWGVEDKWRRTENGSPSIFLTVQ